VDVQGGLDGLFSPRAGYPRIYECPAEPTQKNGAESPIWYGNGELAALARLQLDCGLL